MTTCRPFRTAVVAALVMVVSACGVERSVTGDTSPIVTGAPVTTSATDATIEPTVPTTEPVLETSTVPAEPADAWTPISYDEFDMPLSYPCCASNWGLSAPSPDLPAPGEPLADGVYSVEWTWPDDMSQPVVATVGRFDRCSALPEGSCQQQDTYLDSEYGVGSESVEVEIRFDDSLRVVLGGYVGFDYADKSSALQVGSGTALADLITHLDADYRAAVVDRVLAGADPWDVAEILGASPERGFSLPLGEGPEMHQIVYTYLDAPPLLYQALLPFEVDPADARGADNIGRIALRVDGGRYTVSVYAGWYS